MIGIKVLEGVGNERPKSPEEPEESHLISSAIISGNSTKI
jgi:hypothetical protein